MNALIDALIEHALHQAELAGRYAEGSKRSYAEARRHLQMARKRKKRAWQHLIFARSERALARELRKYAAQCRAGVMPSLEEGIEWLTRRAVREAAARTVAA